jgi:hypothetical protein
MRILKLSPLGNGRDLAGADETGFVAGGAAAGGVFVGVGFGFAVAGGALAATVFGFGAADGLAIALAAGLGATGFAFGVAGLAVPTLAAAFAGRVRAVRRTGVFVSVISRHFPS